MSTTAIPGKNATANPSIGQVELKLEVIPLPVSDLDRAKEFYGGLGWPLDADFRHNGDRAIQFTPPGSQCSIHFNPKGKPGSAQGMFLVVSDIEAARANLIRRGVEVSEIFHFASGPGPKLVRYNRLPKGGHFAAWEQPQLLSQEVRAGFRSLR
jgi:hypothetical protein